MIISRFKYHLLYLNPSQTEKLKLEALIRKVTNVALGVPMSTSNEALFRTGTHNTIDEIVSVHLANQVQRLRATEQGRSILSSINFDTPPRNEPQEVKGPFLDSKTRDLLKVAPLPRNMDLERNEGRRRQSSFFTETCEKISN